MSFIWPPMLLCVALVPIGVLVYLAVGVRRHRRLVAAYGKAGLRPVPAGRSARLWRWTSPVLLIGGLLVMTVALARPQGVVALPREEGIVILAFDISGSMAATDLTPTRMEAARVAAMDFVDHQPSGISIGVVAFSDSGISVQVPTGDRSLVDSAIDRLAPQKGTSVGRGILASLDVMAAAEAGPWVDYYTQGTPQPTTSPTPVPAGTHAPAVIVLLTDGENNEVPDPLAAAQAAADRGVRIYTVGIGSVAGTTLNLDGFNVHTQLDEATLQQIAQISGGTYYAATDTQKLVSIYDNLDTALLFRPELTELTAIFAGVSLLLLMAGAAGSLLALGRLS